MPHTAPRLSGTSLFGNVKVLPWYTVRELILTGGCGVSFLLGAGILPLLSVLGLLPFSASLPAGGACAVLAALCFLLGIRSVDAKAPWDCRKAARFSFLQKSILFLPAWILCAISCVFLVGVFCKVRRLGTAVSRTPENCYTAFPDGRKVQVTRIREGSDPRRPLYRDAAGNLYRPPVALKRAK